MSIRWYQPKHRYNVMGDFFSLSKAMLRFSWEASEKYFKNMPYLSMGYDELTNAIYLRPNSDKEGYKISREKVSVGIIRIKWAGFLKANSIHFEKPCSVKILQAAGDIYVLSLKGMSNL